MAVAGPNKIGKYDVEERVGEGAMGVVYRALDPVLKRRVAIKVMSDAFAQNTDLRERFLREAQAAGSLQHPNVITIYDFGDVEGHPYIAMEFVEGQDLAELIAHQVPLSVVDKLDLAIGVLQGLAYAHKRGIVHRDIKPANIRVDDEGKARIMDFGVAHLASSNMTRSGVMLGTPSYMAPEQIVGGKVGPQTDIFSVGAVLYELLTGVRPFHGDTLQAVMYQVLSGNPAPLSTNAPALPARLNEVVMRALAKEAENRYPSALDMANDLIAVRASMDSSAASPGTLSLRATIETAIEDRKSRAVRATRNRRVLASSGGIAVAVVLVMSGWLLARRAAPSAPAQASRGGSGAAAQRQDSVVPPSTPAPAVSQPLASSPRTGRPADSPNVGATPRPTQTPASRKASVTLVGTKPDSAAPPRQTVAQVPERPAATQMPSPGVNPPSVSPAGQVPPPGAPISPQPVVVTPPTPPSDVRPSGAVSPTAPVSPAANATAEIGAVIDSYARAIESRDMGELRRVYAAITPDQARAFSDFFSSTRTLTATLATKILHVDGVNATASVSGVYEFTTNNGRTQRQPVTFQVELHRDGSAWKLVAVR